MEDLASEDAPLAVQQVDRADGRNSSVRRIEPLPNGRGQRVGQRPLLLPPPDQPAVTSRGNRIATVIIAMAAIKKMAEARNALSAP